MKKIVRSYVCQSCATSYSKWQGKCHSCNKWNSVVEEIIDKDINKNFIKDYDISSTNNQPSLLEDIFYESHERRIHCNDKEFSRVLGGGIVKGSLILIGGEPGIGKSTLVLQTALSLSKIKVLYVSGEESMYQIKMRSLRLSSDINLCYILNETNIETIFKFLKKDSFQLIIIDSIQTLYTSTHESSVGSVSQVRACTAILMSFAKRTSIPILIIGHITKEGTIAGPKVLEHMVDTVLQFEGDRNSSYRILRTIKNRFGSTSELGIYEMQSNGLRQVSNPSEILLSEKFQNISGVAIGAFLEGNRPLLIEAQALVSKATFGVPQRSATGFDTKRLNMLLAVLEKRAKCSLGTRDVFLNITGGLKVDDPALDLAISMAIVSSYFDINFSQDICFSAEVGLGGEIRPVNRVEKRISEAQRLGFKTIYLSAINCKSIKQSDFQITIVPCKSINEIIKNTHNNF